MNNTNGMYYCALFLRNTYRYVYLKIATQPDEINNLFFFFENRMIELYEQSTEESDDQKTAFVMCPICQTAELQYNNHLLHCNCGFQ